jgi:alpha-1,3-rhamnosyl/mannosyltransferase
MRIGIDARTLDDAFPGIARYVENLLDGLEALPNDGNEFIAFYDPTSRRAEQRLTSQGRIQWVPTSAPVAGLREQVSLPLLARRVRLDLLHAPFLATPLAWPCPLVVTIHDLIPLDYPNAIRSRSRYWLWRGALEVVSRRAASVLTVSHTARERLARHSSRLASKLMMTPNAVHPHFRPAGEEHRTSARQAVGARRMVLFLGMARAYRNLPRLLRCWRALEARGETLGHSLVIAGPPSPCSDELEEQARGMGLRDVCFPGFIPADLLPGLYSAASLVVQPSMAEGFGLTVVEAMACGTPVACAQATAAAEVAGGVGWTFDPHDDADMTETLSLAIAETGAQPDNVWREAVRRAGDFSCERAARLTIDAWQCTLERRRVRQAPNVALPAKGSE